MRRALARLLGQHRSEQIIDRLLARACQHPHDGVVADILDGDMHGGPAGEQAVMWCRRCGAYCRVHYRDAERVAVVVGADGTTTCRVVVGPWRHPGLVK